MSNTILDISNLFCFVGITCELFGAIYAFKTISKQPHAASIENNGCISGLTYFSRFHKLSRFITDSFLHATRIL